MDFFYPPDQGPTQITKNVVPHNVPYKVSALAKAMERALSEIPTVVKNRTPQPPATRPDWIRTFSE